MVGFDVSIECGYLSTFTIQQDTIRVSDLTKIEQCDLTSAVCDGHLILLIFTTVFLQISVNIYI